MTQSDQGTSFVGGRLASSSSLTGAGGDADAAKKKQARTTSSNIRICEEPDEKTSREVPLAKESSHHSRTISSSPRIHLQVDGVPITSMKQTKYVPLSGTKPILSIEKPARPPLLRAQTSPDHLLQGSKRNFDFEPKNGTHTANTKQQSQQIPMKRAMSVDSSYQNPLPPEERSEDWKKLRERLFRLHHDPGQFSSEKLAPSPSRVAALKQLKKKGKKMKKKKSSECDINLVESSTDRQRRWLACFCGAPENHKAVKEHKRYSVS